MAYDNAANHHGRQTVRKSDLAGLCPREEVCIMRIYPDGSLYLAHVQMDLEDEEGHWRGNAVFNGEIRIPPGLFEWLSRAEETDAPSFAP